MLLELTSGCIRDVTIHENDVNRQLVVNSILDPVQDTIVVHVSWSKPVQAALPFEHEKQAHVVLIEEDRLAGEFIWSDSSAYILPYKTKYGHRYKIEVSASGKTAWGETVIPDLLDAEIRKAFPGIYPDIFVVTLFKKENSGKHYWISATGYTGPHDDQKISITCSVLTDYELADDFNQNISDNSRYRFEYDVYMRFSDKGALSDTLNIEVNPQCIGLPKTIYLFEPDVHLDRYMKSSLLLHKMDLYAEDSPVIYAPFPVFSNIHGGTGIFGSYSSVSRKFFKE